MTKKIGAVLFLLPFALLFYIVLFPKDPLFVGNDNDNTLNTHNYIRLNDGNYILRRNGNTILHLQFSKMTSDINRDNIYELYDIRFTASRQEYQTEMQENQPPGKPGRKSAQQYTKASAENESQPTGKAGYGIYDVSKKELTLKEKPEIILKGQPPVEITGNQMTVYTDSQLLKVEGNAKIKSEMYNAQAEEITYNY